jgi:hypothetical protein
MPAGSTGRAAVAEVDPDQARVSARQILSDRRYRAGDPPRPFRGPLQWLADRIESVAGAVGDVLDRVPLLVWLAVLAAVIAAVVGLVVRAVRRHVEVAGVPSRPARRRAPQEDDPDVLERRADDAERRGELEHALRLRFRAGLLRLDGRGAIRWRPSITTGEVRRRLSSDRFDGLATRFEEVTYGEQPAAAPDLEDARAGWRRVLEEVDRR